MSIHTIRVDQFLLNKLQPEIDKLNLSLISMEENGYDSNPMRDTRNKLNSLIVSYDFLKEYAYGKETIDEAQLNDIMKIAGSYNKSNKSNSQIIQSTRNNIDLNEVGGCLNFIRVYINDEIATSTTLSPLTTPVVFKIYGSDSLKSISVNITVTDSPTVTYTGINNVTIENILLEELQTILLQITTVNICGITNYKTLTYNVQNMHPGALIYWIGKTTERFTISNTDLEESTTLTIDPNSGSAVGTQLTYSWVFNSVNMVERAFLDINHHVIDTVAGDAHALIVVPNSLTVTNIGETVFGTNALMTQGVHYDVFQITNGGTTYDVYYLRDLTNLTFPKRQFQFDII